MSIAERIYYNRTGRKSKETDEDRNYRLSRIYNTAFSKIEKVSDAKGYLKLRQAINVYASEVGKNSLEVERLNKKLKDRITTVSQEVQRNIDELNEEIEKIKNDKFTESVEVLQGLNTQAEHKLLHFMMQLGTNNDGNTGNRRKIGNFVAKADRADAIALMKLASLPQYTNCFTAKQKEIILEKSKNPAEAIWEKNKKPLLTEKNRQLGHEYLRGMNIRNVQKQISNAENNYYFNKEGND